MTEIVLKDIVKRYGDLIAVNNLSLNIKDKEFLVLLGPSGCGKTTTLRCISGLETPDEGKIFIDGEDVTIKRASRRDIAFVFQLYALYPHMTVYGNITYPLINQRYSKEKIKKEVDRVVEILKIKHILNITEIVIPEEFKNDPAKARIEAKRKGKIIRFLDIDEKEEQKEVDFEV